MSRQFRNMVIQAIADGRRGDTTLAESYVERLLAEARADERERIRREVERLVVWVTYQHPEGVTGDAGSVDFETVDRAAVLAILQDT